MKYLAPVPKQYVDESGIPYSGGTVSVYLHDGTTELAEIYSDATGEALMENPCTLDSNGSWQCFVPSGVPLDYIVMDADGNVVSSFIDVVIPEGSGGSSSDMEVVGTPNEILVDRRHQKFVVALSSTIKNSISDLADSVTSMLSALGGKADKVQGATAGNLASLDASGNLTDSGKKAADFATDAQGAKADSAIQGVKVNGTELSKDGNNVVDVPVPTASTATPLKDGTASAGSSTQWARGDHRHPTDDSREAVSNKKQVVNDSSTTEYPSSKAVADFVNSSVATNTANFLGTIAESSLGLDYTATNEQIALALNMHSWVSTPTNNDYCFVSVNDPQTTDVDEYRRFKFNGSVWAYEYTLNNSSFTQEQWDAINSGLTSSDRTTYNAAVTLLNTHVGDSSIHVTSSEKNAWNAKQAAVSTDTDSSAFGDNTAIATGFGSNKLHLNIASRLWTYIQGKISSVLGLTASSYGGKAATAVNNEDSVQLIKGMYAMEAGSSTIPNLINELRVLHGARCGSVRIDSTYTKDNVTIGIGWYNFEYLPHRGNATGDSANYGTLLLSGMTVTTTFYVLCYRSGSVDHLWQLTNTEGSYPNMSVGSAATASAAASGSALETAINSKLDNTGDASNATSTFTKASGDASPMTSGGKLSAIFTAISNVFASFKALAFKDKASYNDLSSGVQSSLDKADSALQAAIEYVTTSSTWQALETAYNAGKTLVLKVENGTNWFDEYRLIAVYKSSGSDRFLFCGFPTMVNLVGGSVESLEVTEWVCYFNGSATIWTTTTVDGLELPTKGYVDGKLPASGTTPITKTYAINIDGNAGTATTVNNLAAVEIEATSSSTVDLNSYNTSSSALGNIGLRVFKWGASSAPYISNNPFNASGILYVGGYGSGFTNQWAINRTTGDIYFRYCEYNATNWLGWKKLTNLGRVGTPTNPVYIDSNGAAQPCGFSVNFGTPVSGANVLNIITS